jgi:type III secretion protein Q
VNSGARIVADRLTAAAPIAEWEWPAVPSSHVHAINAFYRRRRPLVCAIAGKAVAIASEWPTSEADAHADVSLMVGVDGEFTELIMPRRLLDSVIASVDSALSLERLRPDHAGLVVEFALADVLDVVERATGWKLTVSSVISSPPARDEVAHATLFVAVTMDGLGRSPCQLRLPPRLASGLAHHLDRYAGPDEAWLDLPTAVHLRLAAVMLTVAELRSLTPGDIVLLDAICPDDSAIAIFGGHLLVPAEISAAGARLTAAPIKGRGSKWEWIMESQPEASEGTAPDAANLDDLPVHVVLEVGRLELDLSEVRQLAPGAVLPVARQLDEAVDIVANGRRIGRGTIVRIGDSTGVRITRLLGDV